MSEDNITEANVKDVLIISRSKFADERGFVSEMFRLPKIERHLKKQLRLEQGNHTYTKKDVIRGLHIAPFEKIVTCVKGSVQQVIVDCRAKSPTFGKYASVNMGEENLITVYVPSGCANGFLTLSEESLYIYNFSSEWMAGVEKGLLWNDQQIGIEWQTTNPIISEKDENNPTFMDLFAGQIV